MLLEMNVSQNVSGHLLVLEQYFSFFFFFYVQFKITGRIYCCFLACDGPVFPHKIGK